MRVLVRVLCLLSLATGCGEGVLTEWRPPEAPSQTEAALVLSPDATRFRVMAANLTAGNKQSYDTGEGKRIFQALKPDVALLQELNVGTNTEQELRTFVDEAFGADYFVYRELGAQIPNGVVSRFPILAAGEWNDPHMNNRDFAWARLDLPGANELFVVSIHLSAGNSGVRTAQARELASLLQKQLPVGDYLVVGGDLNTGSGGPLNELSRVVRTASPAPTDSSGNSNTNATRKKKLDWVIPCNALDGHQVPVRIAEQQFPTGLVFDSRQFAPINQVEPVQRGDSGAKNMQHMAVVRDFLVPVRPGAAP